MGRPTTKSDLISASAEKYDEMNGLIASLTEEELTTPFDFSKDVRKKEAHWGRDKNLRDVLVHLYEWHQLLIQWVRGNRQGEDRKFLPGTINWKTYGVMNVDFWKKHQNTTLEEAKEMLAGSHQEVMELAERFTSEELFSKGAYSWVGGSTLGSYFVSTTSSHYQWAIKKLKAHRKNCS